VSKAGDDETLVLFGERVDARTHVIDPVGRQIVVNTHLVVAGNSVFSVVEYHFCEPAACPRLPPRARKAESLPNYILNMVSWRLPSVEIRYFRSYSAWGAIQQRYSAKRDSLTNERISENPVLVNTMEKIAPAEFSI
jgi:hypothetical protein